MSIMRLILLSGSLAVTPVLAHVSAVRGAPAPANKKLPLGNLSLGNFMFGDVSVGDVKFGCKITGSGDLDNGFSLYADNNGKTDKTCKATCKLLQDGKALTFSGEMPVSAGDSKTLRTDIVKGTKLSDPEVIDASCH